MFAKSYMLYAALVIKVYLEHGGHTGTSSNQTDRLVLVGLERVLGNGS